MTDPTLQNAEAAAASKVAKAEAWLGSNWYPFGIGAAVGVLAAVVFLKVL